MQGPLGTVVSGRRRAAATSILGLLTLAAKGGVAVKGDNKAGVDDPGDLGAMKVCGGFNPRRRR